jgi:hypothetical protein
VRRGSGTFVSESPPTLSRVERRRRLGEGARRYAALAASLGLDAADAADELSKAWSGLGRAREKSR